MEEGLDYEKIRHEGDLLKTYLNRLPKLAPWILIDWNTNEEVVVDAPPGTTPKDEMLNRYKKASKSEKSIPHLIIQIDKAEREIEKILLEIQAVSLVQDFTSLESLMTALPQKHSPATEKIERIKRALPYQEFLSASGLKIWVGRNARANDELTFKCSNGSDWWLHAQQCSGSHVVIRVAKGKDPDPEAIQDAIQLALYHSKARAGGEGEVCITQRKYVSRLGRQPGKVQVSQHKTVWVRLDTQRYQQIKERTLNKSI